MPAPSTIPAPSTSPVSSARAVFGSDGEPSETTIHFIGGETLEVGLSAEMISQQLNSQPGVALAVLRDALHNSKTSKDAYVNPSNIAFLKERVQLSP